MLCSVVSACPTFVLTGLEIFENVLYINSYIMCTFHPLEVVGFGDETQLHVLVLKPVNLVLIDNYW